MYVFETRESVKFIDFLLDAIAVPKKNIYVIHFGMGILKLLT